MWHIWTIRALMAITTVYSIAYFFILLNQCTPISYFWTNFTGKTTGTCLSTPVVLITTYVHNSISAAADWMLNSLPLFIIIPSAMNWRTKVTALSLLGLGAVASIGIIIRFIALFTITSSNSAVPLSPAVAFWSALEATVGMTAANLATYRPLIRSIARSVRSGPNTDASPAAAAGDNSIINLSKIRWPRSRSSRSAATGGYPRAGYILSDDERDDDDGLAAWEHELGLGGRTTAGSSVDDKSQPHVGLNGVYEFYC
ncbi:integral membrane protein [Neofusicoccum parvum]|uniref:Putative integral membrane protein n=1 Tax=Botryosphaeria parva (strain UCR-NP2) TaxID=1287680 RepID=R1E566_BOTPV|nr:putative integral membrane protein [Neofusicoccum parvum UCRNP2]GME65174.1 integral membrane protein [Neofusicoccum parvum]